MSTLEIAVHADLALVLPTLLIADQLERTSKLPPVTTALQEDRVHASTENVVAQLTLDDGKILIGSAVTEHFVGIETSHAKPRDALSVHVYCCKIYSIRLISETDPGMGQKEH